MKKIQSALFFYTALTLWSVLRNAICHLSVCLFVSLMALSREWKVTETSNLVKIFSLACVTVNSLIFDQNGQMSRSHGQVEYSNRRRFTSDLLKARSADMFTLDFISMWDFPSIHVSFAEENEVQYYLYSMILLQFFHCSKTVGCETERASGV